MALFSQGESHVRTEDISGHGAVMCDWRYLIRMKTGLELCRPGQYPELEREIAGAIDRIDDFIVANSLTPVTKTQLRQRTTELVEREFSAATKLSKSEIEHLCTSELDQELYRRLGVDSMTGKGKRTFSVVEFHEQIDDLLSVPRPPVLEPCL